jgi:hypothetical protein
MYYFKVTKSAKDKKNKINIDQKHVDLSEIRSANMEPTYANKAAQTIVLCKNAKPLKKKAKYF